MCKKLHPPHYPLWFYLVTTFKIFSSFPLASIKAEANRFRDVTFVSGLGDTRYRFFHNAYFLLTNHTVEKERSFHKIDDRKFDMEIVVTFRDPALLASTNVHIMVNVCVV